MVQFNLLPDVKIEFIKARRTKQLMTLISLVLTAAALAVFLFMLFFVNVVQRKSLSDLNTDIKKYSSQLKNTENLDKILTVQNQLGTLTSLHEEKPVASRLFGYISQVTPAQASLKKLTVDFDGSTMSVGGSAPSLDVVSAYTDTLKATRFTVGQSTEKKKAFSDVVLSNFGRDDNGATFTITLKFDPDIFDVNQKAQLVLPTGVITNQANLFGTGN